MKKLMISVLVLLLLLAGCAGSSQEATFPTAPEELAEKTVAFTCYNYDFDVYINYSWQPGPVFYVLTKEYVAPSEITVSVEVEQGYDVFVYDALDGRNHYNLSTITSSGDGIYSVRNSGEFPYHTYLYQDASGMDWADLAEKQAQYSALNQRLSELSASGLGDTAEAIAVSEALEKAQTAYKKAASAYLSDYALLETGDLPTFYLYEVYLYFPGGKGAGNETFHEIQVTVGSETYTVDIGEVRLHTEYVGDDSDKHLVTYAGSSITWDSYPYGQGIEKREGFVLRADDDVTLTGISPVEGAVCSAQILEITLTISDNADGSNGIDILWDGETPISISKGKYVSFSFVFRDDRLKELYYGENLYVSVYYEYDGQTYTETQQCNLYRRNYDPWYWYSICFLGQDLESYFSDYYFPTYGSWRDDYL